MTSHHRLIALTLFSLALLFAACGDDSSGDATPTPEPGDTTEPADVIVIFGGPEMVRSALAGGKDAAGVQMFLLASGSAGDGQFDPAALPTVLIRGAKLVATPRDVDFAERFSAAYPYDAEYPGFREAYDSVYLVALAAAAADSTDPAIVRDNLLFVANSPGEQATASPDGLSRAIELLSAGNDLDLSGASGLLDFSRDSGGQSETSKAAAEVWTILNGAYAPLETRDVDLVAEVDAENPPGELKRGDGLIAPIKIGAIVSITGSDSERGVAIANAMQFAVDEINEAGGIGGQTLELVLKDDGGDPDAAKEAADALTAEAVVAIIGPSTDASAVAVAGDLNSDSPVPLLTLTPAAELAGVESGRLFNVAPLATVETVVLANLAREAKLSVACVIQEDAAGSEAMTAAFRQAFEFKGGQLRAPIIVTAGKEPDYASVLGGCFDD